MYKVVRVNLYIQVSESLTSQVCIGIHARMSCISSLDLGEFQAVGSVLLHLIKDSESVLYGLPLGAAARTRSRQHMEKPPMSNTGAQIAQRYL